MMIIKLIILMQMMRHVRLQQQFMRKNCDFYCKTVADLDRLLEE